MQIILQYQNFTSQPIICLANSTNPNVSITAHISTWQIVPDQIRGYYQYDGSNRQWKVISKPQKFKKMALIVESPHKSEFDSNFNPLAPLNGASGRKFAAHILTRLAAWFPTPTPSNDPIEITIVNPIQYQTSLYHFLNGLIPYDFQGTFGYPNIDPSLRDNVWRFLFEDCDLKSYFQQRISRGKYDYVMNCCTGQKSNSYTSLKTFNLSRNAYKKTAPLKSLVRYSLNAVEDFSYVEDCHPIAWR